MEFVIDNLDSENRGVKILQDSENNRLIVWAGKTETARRTWASLTRKEALAVAGALQVMANSLDDSED